MLSSQAHNSGFEHSKLTYLVLRPFCLIGAANREKAELKWLDWLHQGPV